MCSNQKIKPPEGKQKTNYCYINYLYGMSTIKSHVSRCFSASSKAV